MIAINLILVNEKFIAWGLSVQKTTVAIIIEV